MTKRILLARHGHHDEVGQVLSGRSEIALSAAGQAEAAALSRHLAGVPLDAIYASPRRRTMETAAAVAAGGALDITPAAALDELDFGRFAGRRFDALAGDADWQRWNAERATARCPGGETMREATDRAVAFVAAIPVAAALCVTHCDIIRGMVAHCLGLPLDRIFALGCDPGSLTTLVFDDDGIRLEALNERPR